MAKIEIDDVKASGDSLKAFVEGLGQYREAALEILKNMQLTIPSRVIGIR